MNLHPTLATTELLFSSVSATHSVFYNVQARLPEVVGQSAVAPHGDGAVLGGKIVAVGNRSNRLLVEDSADPDGDSELPDDGTTVQRSEQVQVSVRPVQDVVLTAVKTRPLRAGDPDPERLCLESSGIHVWRWDMDSSGKNEQTPIQAIHTLKKMRAKYEWQDTTTIQVTAGFDLEYKDAKMKGGYTKATERGIGGIAIIPPGWGAGYVRTGVEYRWHRLKCFRPGPVDGRVKQYRPFRVLGGAENHKDKSAAKPCAKRIEKITIGPGNAVVTSLASTTTIAGGVSMFGFGLDSAQTNNSVNKKTFKNVKRSDGYLCGSNNVVLKAAIVREVK